MAPAVPRKGNRGTAVRGEGAPAPVAGGAPPPEVAQTLQKLAEIQA
jgi:hypothetical protein